jgi:hypothetical protein
MLIYSELELNGDLALTAYTHDSNELRALRKVLERAGVYASGSGAPPDAANRPATKYVVPKNLIRAFGSKIGGRFSPNGAFQPGPGGRRSFACERVQLTGVGGECQTLHADDIAAARVACAFLARNLQWFGGIPRPGRCP